MKDKIILKGRKVKTNIFSNALFFGLGRTLQELLGTQSGFTTLRSIGYNMILYLEEHGIDLGIREDPAKTIKNLWKVMIENEFAENVEITKENSTYMLSIENAISCGALNRLCDIYGKMGHIIPCPFFILILASLGKIGYDVAIRNEEYKEGKCILKLDIKKIEFTETRE